MSHAYTQSSVTVSGDTVTVVGAVDGVPVTVQFWASAVSGMTQDQQVAYVAALMLAQAFSAQPENITSQFPSSVTL